MQRESAQASTHSRPARRPARRRLVASGLAALAAMSTIAVGADRPVGAATTVVALWEMNEPPGARVMNDGGPFGLDGDIGTAVQTGAVYTGAAGYRWSNTQPNAAPAKPERLVTVATDDHLDPGAGDYAVEFRYRTTRNFGNVVQKGQNATPGGYFKFEQPRGFMTCLFKGGNGQQRAVRSPIATNDGNWHTIRCERTATYVRLFVDGVQVARLNGPTGTIANTRPLSIGGKSNCDQIRVTCDYFVGDIDYVKIEKAVTTPPPPPPPPPPPENRAPSALFTHVCAALTCTFDGSGATDPDGTVVAHTWTLGDGATATGPVVQHTYAAPGTYDVALTVTDDDGATATTPRTVSVTDGTASEIAYVGGSQRSANSVNHSTTIPAVEPGDGMLLFLTVAASVSVGEPSGVTGWSLVDTAVGSQGSTTVWRKVAAPGDAGATVAVSLSAMAKANLAVVAYRGTSGADPVADAARTVHASGTTRTTPTVDVATAGAHVVSYWSHRDSTTTALTPPPGVSTRLAGSQSGGGRVTMLLADSGGPVQPGPYGGLTATASASSSFGTAWTIVLAPA
jgi:PKD repeat protein